jgi:excisionase family DNA binding protein
MLFRASDVARFCDVDLKTVHNWADKGRIQFFRTPGRHLRFKPAALLAFLSGHGYDVPPEVREEAAKSQPASAA